MCPKQVLKRKKNSLEKKIFLARKRKNVIIIKPERSGSYL